MATVFHLLNLHFLLHELLATTDLFIVPLVLSVLKCNALKVTQTQFPALKYRVEEMQTNLMREQ